MFLNVSKASLLRISVQSDGIRKRLLKASVMLQNKMRDGLQSSFRYQINKWFHANM